MHALECTIQCSKLKQVEWFIGNTYSYTDNYKTFSGFKFLPQLFRGGWGMSVFIVCIAAISILVLVASRRLGRVHLRGRMTRWYLHVHKQQSGWGKMEQFLWKNKLIGQNLDIIINIYFLIARFKINYLKITYITAL